jgi:L-alanine-DL-glutamate epimerase-like enolase superfamily enzyme
MHITQIELYKYDIPLKAPISIAIGTIREARSIVVKISTNEGVYGLGEGSPFWMIVGETQESALANAQHFAKILIGQDPRDIEGNLRRLDDYLPHNFTCKSAFDMALYDLNAKLAGMPLYRYLGGSKRSIVTDETVYIDSPERMAEVALGVKSRGAEAIKVKLGRQPEEDIRRIETIRAAVGAEIPIRIDANQGWDKTAALRVLHRLSAHQIEYCEQPVKAHLIADLAWVRQHSPIPICADESLFTHTDALRLIQEKAVDYFNIKLSKSGGIHTALKINALAEAAGIRCMIGCMSESRLAISANAHLASARQNIVFFDLDAPFEHAADPVQGGARYENHYQVTLPDTPGHGADLALEYLASLPHWIVN